MAGPLLALGPLAGIAAIIGGISASRQRREDELAAKQLDDRRKIALNEIASFQKEGRHGDIEANRDAYTQLGIHPDDLDRSISTAGRYANSRIALDAETAAKSGFQPYLGAPGQMQQAMQMLGQGGQGQPTQPQPQPTLPPGFADQAQATLPPGAPGQIAAQASTSPQIGAAPWQYPGTEQQGGAAPIAPPALSDGGQRMTPDAKQFTPIQTAQPQQFDYQGKPIALQPQSDLIPQPIRPEPIAMAERKQFGVPTTQATPQFGGLQFPKLKSPITLNIDAPGGHASITDKSPDKGTTTKFMIAQATQRGMSPDELERHYNEWAITQKGLAPELDHQQMIEAKDKYFSTLAVQKKIELQSTAAGRQLDPSLLDQAAERAAFEEMGRYVPSKGGSSIAFSPEERHLSLVNQATGAAARELEVAARIVEAGGKYKPDFGTSFTDIIDNSPALTPEQKSHIKQQFAQKLATRLADKAKPDDPLGRMKSMLTAASMTGGAVPHEWQQLVMGDPKSFGMSQAMVDKYLTGKYNIFEPGGYDRLANAVADDAIQGKLIDAAIAHPDKADVYMGAAQGLRQQSVASPGAPAASPLAGIGPASRAIDVQQREAESAAGVKGTKVEERRQVIESVAQPLSDLAKSMKRYMDIPLTNVTDSSNAAKLYSSQLKTMRSILAKGVLLQSGALNEQEQEAAMGALSGLIEAKAFPDVADEKIATLNRLMTKAFGKPVDLLADDPLNPQSTPTLKFDRQGNPIGQPSTSPPPPPPTPQPGMPQTAPAQMMPMSAPTAPTPAPPPQQSSLPPINEQAARAKAANPQEAAPKFGPGSTKAAAATVPPEIQSALTHQDKVALANAMHKFGRGDIDDRQLELEVAKVLMRVGGKKLEGQALNRAVTAYTEILRRGTAAKQKAANGQ